MSRELRSIFLKQCGESRIVVRGSGSYAAQFVLAYPMLDSPGLRLTDSASFVIFGTHTLLEVPWKNMLEILWLQEVVEQCNSSHLNIYLGYLFFLLAVSYQMGLTLPFLLHKNLFCCHLLEPKSCQKNLGY